MRESFLCPQIVFGWDALEELAQWQAKRVAIVTDRVMHDLGAVSKVQAIFARASIQARVVGCIDREPYVEDVGPLVNGLRDVRPDLIVALGGGAVMDAAKAAWAFYEQPELDWRTAFTVNGITRGERRARFVAIPTTSGAGSEVSRVAVLIDSETRLKRLILSPQILPDAAILDPELTLTMPKPLTANSGFDALTHAVEALVTQTANEFSNANALQAVQLIFQYLPDAYVKNDRTARAKMHYAASLASLAATNSFAGIAHGMDQVGPLFHLPHGLVCAVLLPYTIEFNLDAAHYAYAEMGRAVGVASSDVNGLARGFLQQVMLLARKVNLPTSFQQCGVPESEYFSAMDMLVNSTLAARSTQTSPRVPDALQAHELFERAYWGRLVWGY